MYVTIPTDLPRKRGAMKQNAIVSPGKTMMGKTVRRRESPCVRRLRLLYNCRVVHNFNGKKKREKSEEEAKVMDGGKKGIFVAVDGD
jgi:hypothetical protein